MTIFSSIDLSVDCPAHTSFRADFRPKRQFTVPFLISVSLHLIAAWTFSQVAKDAPYQQPTHLIEVDIVTPVPEKVPPLPQAPSRPKVVAPARPLPRSKPPVATPKPAPTIEPARGPARVVDRSVVAATAQEKSVTATPQALNASLPHSASPVAAVPANRSRSATESGKANLPVVGPSYDAAYLSNPPPPYPVAARRLKMQGTVTVRVMVSADGRPTSVTLQNGSGVRILDEAALEAVRHWSFVAARRGDQAIAAAVDVPVRFKLN